MTKKISFLFALLFITTIAVAQKKEKIKCLMSLKDYNEIYKCEEIVKSNIKKDNINQKEIKNQQATHYNNENKNDEEYIDKKELIKKCIKEATTKEELDMIIVEENLDKDMTYNFIKKSFESMPTILLTDAPNTFLIPTSFILRSAA